MDSILVGSTSRFTFRKLSSGLLSALMLVSLPAAFAQTRATSYQFSPLAVALDGRDHTKIKALTEQSAYPIGVAVDDAGNAYLADQFTHTISKITSAGVVTTLAGTPGMAGAQDGSGSAARFNSPTGVAVDHAGNLYIADQNNHTIRKIDSAGVVSTFAGQAGQTGSTDGTGADARFYIPAGVAVDANGNVYVADLGNDTIRKITSEGITTTLAGTAGDSGFSNGTGRSARFLSPKGVAVDHAGNVYVADLGNEIVRKITSGGVVTTLAGTAGQPGLADGTGLAALFNSPISVAVDRTGNVFVTDSFNTIRRITANGTVNTVAATASARQIGPDAQLIYPSGVAVDATGNLYIADNGSNALHKGVPASQYADLPVTAAQ